MKYTNSTTLAGGLRIGSAAPIDDRLVAVSKVTLAASAANNEYLSWFDGMPTLVTDNNQWYVWGQVNAVNGNIDKSKKLLDVDVTYPSYVPAPYGNTAYNFYPLAVSGTVDVNSASIAGSNAVEADFNVANVTVTTNTVLLVTHNGQRYLYKGPAGDPVTTAVAGDFVLVGSVTVGSALQIRAYDSGFSYLEDEYIAHLGNLYQAATDLPAPNNTAPTHTSGVVNGFTFITDLTAINYATEVQAGVVQIATIAQAQGLNNDSRVLTPTKLRSVISAASGLTNPIGVTTPRFLGQLYLKGDTTYDTVTLISNKLVGGEFISGTYTRRPVNGVLYDAGNTYLNIALEGGAEYTARVPAGDKYYWYSKASSDPTRTLILIHDIDNNNDNYIVARVDGDVPNYADGDEIATAYQALIDYGAAGAKLTITGTTYTAPLNGGTASLAIYPTSNVTEVFTAIGTTNQDWIKINADGGTYVTSIAGSVPVPNAVGGIAAGTLASALNGKSFNELWDDLLFPTVLPTYTTLVPTLTKSNGWANFVEVGLDTTIGLAASINVNDAGAISTVDFKAGSTTLFADTTSPYAHSYATGVLTTPTTLVYTATANHAQSTKKNDNKGNVDPRNWGDPNGPLAAGAVVSNTLTFRSIFPYFYGKVAGSATTVSAGDIALGNKVLAVATGDLVVPFNTNGAEKGWIAIPVSAGAQTSTVYTAWFITTLNSGAITAGGFILPPAIVSGVDINGVTHDYNLYIYGFASAAASVTLKP
jgi:hypothetical protein